MIILANFVPRSIVSVCIVLALSFVSSAQSATAEKDIYERIKAFDLNGGKVDVSNLTLKRDRVVMNFAGTFYLSAPVDGKVTGAVFVGNGTFKADPPDNEFERANLKRLIKADSVVADFTTAVLRFTDDTASLIGTPAPQAAAPQAVKAAAEVDAITLKETGANIPARVLISILNQEKPGFFFAAFDGGKFGKLRYLLDH